MGFSDLRKSGAGAVRRKSFGRIRKIASLVTVLFFVFEQLVFSAPNPVESYESLQPEQSQKELNPQSNLPVSALAPVPVTSDQFLQETLTLTPAAVASEDNPESSDAISSGPQNYEYEKYDLEDALPILEQGVPAAFILKSVTAVDLEKLSRLPFETALALLDGEIILFTSGDEAEIKTSRPVLDLLVKAENITHFHVSGHGQEGPSQFDLNLAVKAPEEEYVVTARGVYAYNANGILNAEAPLTYLEFALRYRQRANELSRDRESSVKARGRLNEFIRQMDFIAQNSTVELVTFREAVVDTIPPTGSIVINGGAAYTNAATVTLTLSATDPYSPLDVTGDNLISPLDVLTVINYINVYGSRPVNDSNRKYDANRDNAVTPADVLVIISELNGNGGGRASSGIGRMSFSTDNLTWTAPEPYAGSKSLVLPSGDGGKTVRVKFYDNAGNVSTVYPAAIILDTTAPAVVLDASTPSLIEETTMTVHYTADGIRKTKTFTNLVEGENALTIIEHDLAGNQTVFSFKVTVAEWKPAASNPNYAFRIKRNASGYTLELRDTQTGQITLLFSGTGNVPDVLDVTANGRMVIYEGNGGAYVQRIGSPEQKVTVQGDLKSIQYYSYYVMLKTDTQYPSGTVFRYSTGVTINTDVPQYVSTFFVTLITAGTGFYRNDTLSVAVQVEYYPATGQYQALIYNLYGGNDYSSSIRSVDLGQETGASGGTFTLVNAVAAPNGETVITLGLDSPTFNKTYLINHNITFDGAATAVTYQDHYAVYTVRNNDGSTRFVRFDLDTFQLIPDSPGWTRTLSNPDYFFKMVEEGGLKKLLLLNLRNGQQTQAATLTAGGEYPRFQNSVDVSPDGTTVIYGTMQSAGNSAVYAQRLANPDKKFLTSGMLQSVRFALSSETVWLDFQDGKSILLILSASSSEPPQILEERKPNGVTSYFSTSDGALERMTIGQTGGAEPLPSVTIVRPLIIQTPTPLNQRTLKFDQAMRGVRYEVQFRTSLMSGDWQTAGSFVADHYGEVIWQDPVPDRGNPVYYRVVAKEMTTAADLLTQINLLYFDPAFGLVESTHEYPLEGWASRSFTQPSNFGFYAYLLATIAAGDLVTSQITKVNALTRLETLMNNLVEDQQNLGFMGLLPWFGYTGSDWVRMNDIYGRQVSFEDNSNLSNALAVAYGALLDDSFAGNTQVSGILADINTFLQNQRAGYLAMYNSGTNTFYRTMQIQGGGFSGGTIDYFGAESSAPLLFLILQYGDTFPASAYTKLNFATRTYTMQDLSPRQVVAPFTGAFHMYWPALLMPESQNPDLRNMLETYTDVQLDFASRNEQPGLLSASYDVGAYNFLDRYVSAFSWAGDVVRGVSEGSRFHVTSSTNAGIGVVFKDDVKFTFEGSAMQLHYSSTTPVPNAKIEFKKKVGGILQTVYTKNLSLENTGGIERTVSFSLPLTGVLGELEEVVFVTSGGGPLDLTFHSFDTERIAYNFPLGIKSIALNQAETVETTPSVYNLGAAYMFRPAQVEALFQGLIADHRGLVSAHGLWEGLNVTNGKVVYEQVFNNMATFIVGMTGTGPSYMTRYLETKGLRAELESIWNSQTPVSVTENSTAFDFSFSPYKVTAWKLTTNVRTSGRQIRFTYRATSAIQGVKLELKHPGSSEPIYRAQFNLPSTGGAEGEFILSVPESVLYWYISEMVVLFPELKGFPSSAISRIILAPAGVASPLAPASAKKMSAALQSLAGTPSYPTVQQVQKNAKVLTLEQQIKLVTASLNASFSKLMLKKMSKAEKQQLQLAWTHAQKKLNVALLAAKKTGRYDDSLFAFEQTTRLFRDICAKLLF
jgi:hypothetical protein